MYTEELGPVEEQRGQSHSEDPFHLNKAAKEHKGKPKESSFVEDVSTALYQMMAEDELEGLLTDMKGYAAGTGVEKWVNKLLRRKEHRCFVHTSRHFICAEVRQVDVNRHTLY